MFKELYNKTIKLAGHKRSKSILGFISFIESFIFPIPPDVLIIPMTIARKHEWIRIALIATIGSVLGACLGYLIGYVFFNEIGLKIFEIYGRENLDNLPIYDPSKPGDGWILLGKFESFKPSGLPPGSNTEEDYLFQDNGEDFVFEFESQSREIRYIRFINIESWNNQMVTVIGELSFWGGVID